MGNQMGSLVKMIVLWSTSTRRSFANRCRKSYCCPADQLFDSTCKFLLIFSWLLIGQGAILVHIKQCWVLLCHPKHVTHSIMFFYSVQGMRLSTLDNHEWAAKWRTLLSIWNVYFVLLQLICCDTVGHAVERHPCWTVWLVVKELRNSAATGRVRTTRTAAEGPERFVESTERWLPSLQFRSTLLLLLFLLFLLLFLFFFVLICFFLFFLVFLLFLFFFPPPPPTLFLLLGPPQRL